MEHAAPFESCFAEALLRPEKPVPIGVTSHNAKASLKRFSVYRNNVVAGLVNALRKRFPVVEQLVGAEFFAAMARIFVMEQPPRSPILMTYGDAFPDFIAAFAPAAELFYLPDVARLEAARTRAYHAADVAPLAPAAFAATEPDDLAELRFVLHPSVEIVRSAHPIVTIWAMHSGEAKLGPIPDWRPQDALVARPRLDVEIRALPPGAAAFLIALRQGAPLEGAANAALAEEREFALAENLAVLIGSGLATDICRPTAKLDRP